MPPTGARAKTVSTWWGRVCVCVCVPGVMVTSFWTHSNKHPGMFSLCVCVCVFLQARARWRQARAVRSREEAIRQMNRWVLWTWRALPAGEVWAARLLPRLLRPRRPPTSQPPDPGAGTLYGARNVISPTFFHIFLYLSLSCCYTHNPTQEKKWLYLYFFFCVLSDFWGHATVNAPCTQSSAGTMGHLSGWVDMGKGEISLRGIL